MSKQIFWKEPVLPIWLQFCLLCIKIDHFHCRHKRWKLRSSLSLSLPLSLHVPSTAWYALHYQSSSFEWSLLPKNLKTNHCLSCTFRRNYPAKKNGMKTFLLSHLTLSSYSHCAVINISTGIRFAECLRFIDIPSPIKHYSHCTDYERQSDCS